ncbi:DUF503 domain-containing protein [Fimbriimonas ginsengisoli]|uniref:YlxP-like protein n=1 Tax=Fimbriimonas ginsengisoli Gsoil 348 TaxID=661478 RepID=A0A068NXG7_FIMGI|nr:DUF503 domain-containing protein [Fimbriimonas ginsengisoli]AIE86329.1 hypothetical protein OP10G_2961 [Fimbriimonas ginsengisoli Gsoil 348]
MIIGTLEVELRLDGCFNLKEKRRVLQSLLQRLRNETGVAVAEIADHDLWNSAVVGIATVSAHVSTIESVLDHVLSRIDADPGVEIVSLDRRVERT